MAGKVNRSIGRSFRIKEQWLNILDEEANRTGVTPNALINIILQRYCEFERFLNRLHIITVDARELSKILDLCSREALENLAKNEGSPAILNLFRLIGLEYNCQNADFFIQKIGADYAKWYTCEHYTIRNRETYVLTHDLGEKWSMYLAEVMGAVLERCCNKKIRKEFLPGSIILELLP